MWYKKIIAFSLILTLLTVFLTPITVVAADEESSYSTVLEDLEKTDNFSFDSFGQGGELSGSAGNYSLDVFHIAEGENGKLVVYVYQPGSDRPDIRAGYINMSLQHYENTSPEYKRYSLTYIDSYKTLQKYVVDDFNVSDSSVRYYNIASVYRKNYPELDNTGGVNKAFPVGKCFVAYDSNGETKYEAFKTEVVNISIKDCASIRYFVPGSVISANCKDLHYIAFSVENFDITELYDVTVEFTLSNRETILERGLSGSTIKTNILSTSSCKAVIRASESTVIDGYFGKKYTWNNIVTVDEFKETLNEEGNEIMEYDEDIDSAEFVVMYKETDTVVTSSGSSSKTVYSKIDDVSILRLHFATIKGTYNLGVVSDSVPDEGSKFNITFSDQFVNALEDFFNGLKADSSDWKWLETLFDVIGIVCGTLLVLAALPYLKPIFAVIGNGLSELWNFVSAPFKKREKREKRKNEKRK